MQMISTSFLAGKDADRTPLRGGVAADLLWAAALPADRLEHVYCEPGEAGLRFVLFIRTPSRATACAVTASICRRALGASPALRGWHLAGEPCPRRAASTGHG